MSVQAEFGGGSSNGGSGSADSPSPAQHGAVLMEGCGCAACAQMGGNEAAGDGLSGLTGGKAIWGLDQINGNFLRSNANWSAGSTLIYSFRESAPPGADSAFQFRPVAEIERSLTREGFDLISDLINLNFVEAPDDGRATNVSNRIYFTKDAGAPSFEWGHAQRYSVASGERRLIVSAEVVMSASAVAARQWFTGGYNFQALMHEQLHTLGIPHPGNYNANGEPITYAANAEYAQDSRQFTIMSYFPAATTGADHLVDSKAGVYSGATPLLHDVSALQALYGANMSTRAGDTVYGYNSTAGRAALDFTRNTTPIFTIWDGGGRDRLDFSGTDLAVNVNLNAGQFSDAFEMTNNISIAHGVTIEDAVGGSASDRILGNAADNALAGGAGDDILSGGGGADRLDGGDGEDALGGDDGADFLDGGAGRDSLFGGVGNDHLIGGADADRLEGQDGDDLIGGQDGDDFIDGGSGRDTLFGDGGRDHMVGGTDGDGLFGQDGDDLIGGQDGDDFIDGGNGRDTLYGDAGQDHLIGGSDDDGLFGQDGDDLIGGQDGNDFIDGGNGRDTLFGDAGDDFLNGGAGIDNLFGGSGRDHIVGGSDDDRLHGGEGDDLMGGQDGNDYLEGGAGRDTLYGDAGDDLIFGGADGDLLTGNGGADRFVHLSLADSTTADRDRIFDFDAAAGDRIDLSAIDADVFLGGDQGFRFVAAFSNAAGEAILRFDGASNTTTLSLDVNADGVADFVLDLSGNIGSGSGFIV